MDKKNTKKYHDETFFENNFIKNSYLKEMFYVYFKDKLAQSQELENIEFFFENIIKEQKTYENIEALPVGNQLITLLMSKSIKQDFLLNFQEKIKYIEKENSLESQLGKLFIDSVSSFKSFILFPKKIIQQWIGLTRTNIPRSLGKNFTKLLKTYDTQGEDGVEALLNAVFITSQMRAEAYTSIARHVKQIEPIQAVKYAIYAYQYDPKPYRLKWLAFRIYEADDVLTAEALIDLLPSDITMSEWEQQQSYRIHKEAEYQRQRDISRLHKKIINKLSNALNIQKETDIEKEQNNLLISENNNIQLKLKETVTNYEREILKLQSEIKLEKEQNNLLISENNNIQLKLKETVTNYEREILKLQSEIKLEKEQNKALTINNTKLENNSLYLKKEINKKIEYYKSEYNSLAIQMAELLQYLFCNFSNKPNELSKVIKVIVGNNQHLKDQLIVDERQNYNHNI